MAESQLTPQPAISVSGCGKTYPSVVALEDVSLSVYPGEVRGLVGQNGAGKSTLIKIIAGAVDPDSGELMVNGEPLKSGVVAHRRAGISVIYQDPHTIPELTAVENVFLGDLPHNRVGWVTRRRMLEGFRALCAELNVTIDPDRRASALSLGDRQLLEIMRAIRTARTVLILDEPTSALPEHERSRLFEVIRRVQRVGVAIIFISHDLDEVLEVCESVTVLRDGRHVATGPTEQFDIAALVESMTGERPEDYLIDEVERHRGAEVVGVDGLTTGAGARGVTLTVRSGEIVGLAGLLGSGRTEVLRALAGVDKVNGGTLRLRGVPQRWPSSISQAKRDGMHMVPEDRRALGLVGERTVTENISLGVFDRRRWFSWMSDRREAERQAPILATVHFPPGRQTSLVRTLSGGNQQKVLLARLLQQQPELILLDEPTAGIDVKATAQILDLVRELAAKGAAVLVVLSDLQELLHLTDRVYVMQDGRTVAEFDSDQVTENQILHLAFATQEGITA